MLAAQAGIQAPAHRFSVRRTNHYATETYEEDSADIQFSLNGLLTFLPLDA